MPLIKGKSRKVQRKNFTELTLGQIGEKRRKGIKTLMRRRNISFEQARRLQAKAIVSNL